MLSIIIPAKNEADNLGDILDYFKNKLSNTNFELILINDFSDDETLSKAKKMFESESNFRVLDNLQVFWISWEMLVDSSGPLI